MPPLRNRRLDRSLILLQHLRALLQRLFRALGVEALVAERVGEDDAFGDGLGLGEVGEGMPGSSDFAEGGGEGWVGFGCGDADEFVAEFGVGV